MAFEGFDDPLPWRHTAFEPTELVTICLLRTTGCLLTVGLGAD